MGTAERSNMRIVPPEIRNDGARGISSVSQLFNAADDGKCLHTMSIEHEGHAVTVQCCISPYHDSNHVALVETDNGEGFYVSIHWRSL